MSALFKSSGLVHYSTDPYRVIIEIDQGIADFYRWLVPRSWKIQRQMHPAHISVVRKAVPASLEAWGKHEGESVEFEYSNIIEQCEIYYWINAYSLTAERIREELGLPVYDSVAVPPGYRQRFHITIGNRKG